ncbi:hypothetical protein [Polaribacter pacificus]|nr:hypothetical protein [Polaribacter pacificus]
MLKTRKYISLVFLTFFILMKTVGLHSLKHFDENLEEYCEACEFAITANTTPLIAENPITFEASTHHFFKKKNTPLHYSFVVVKNNIDSTLLSRPPPTS